ncbi:MAG: Na+/H+ antiporter NhaC family protein, partial [Bacillota bacterium]|nr:Na+/H+ antiporter NhaC family protein [Bacillota bacterium]
VVSENAWFVLVFGFFGMVIVLLEKSGGALGFADWGAKIAKTRGMTILITWILGILVFIDDYLNNLGVGTAMRNIGDKNKIPRELMAYTINSTGAAVCVLVPMSSWAILMISQYEELGVMVDGSSFTAYIHTIPFIFYAWAAVLVVPLIGFKIIPTWGPMRKAEKRAAEGDTFSEYYHKTHEEMEGYTDIKKASPWFFIIPMGILIAVTLITNDILVGMAVGFVACLVLYVPTKLMTLGEFCDHSVEGFKSMVLVTAIVISAYVLQAANGELGLTEYVISVAEPVLSAKLLPVIAFIICAFIAMCTGSFWGTMTIASPILIPLAVSLGGNPILAGAAIVSAGAFGSHACFYGDAATLASAVTGISNAEYAKTSLPMIALPAIIAIVLFTIAGFVW